MAVASAGPYANHSTLIQTDNHASTSSLNFYMPVLFQHPTNIVKALKESQNTNSNQASCFLIRSADYHCGKDYVQPVMPEPRSPAAANGNIPIMLTIIKRTIICFHLTNTRTKTKEKFFKNKCDVKYNVVRSSQKLK